MNETIEDRLRNMLLANALHEVPDSTAIPPRRRGDELGRARARRAQPWFVPAIAGVAAAVLAVTATLFFVRDRFDSPVNSLVGIASGSRSSTSLASPKTRTIAVTIPKDLIGKSYDDAALELTDLGRTPVKQVVDSTSPFDEVLTASGPKVGQSPMSVNLRVSNNELFVVPELANLTPESATAQLVALGWKGDVTTLNQRLTPTTDSSLVGLIASGSVEVLDSSQKPLRAAAQTPAAGATANKAVGITVVVYAKKQSPVPTTPTTPTR